jgi:aminopeptidase N
MSQPEVIYLKDYQVPAYLIEKTDLRFELDPTATLVKARLTLRRNPDTLSQDRSLFLHGDSSLVLHRVSVNDQVLSDKEYQRSEEGLTLPEVPDQFVLETVVEINPEANTALEGLYLSDGFYCTQCEAEGFRRITFYIDRPDVMSVFTTTLVADKNAYPVLLSNGNPVDQGDSEEGRHWVTWEDPFKKPAYLFALVAGDLQKVQDHFTTVSGRKVTLEIYADQKDLDKLHHAMESLKAAMKWDEEVYGREYDLDIYMIVAVDFFNMGAMENKGLNIFNTSCVLASPQTTTDLGFQRVEGVVAHEYFHNWSGNRVTCRDWFQLSLKEGFTVFRDAEFSADMNSSTVKRIEDVSLLRTAQFAEDAGPMAHPIRPASFIEISNFYTMTVYEKGAEVVRMIHTLLGADGFRKGSDLYFERHDGQAVTTDDFVKAMEDATGKDLTQFKRWYEQAGTPVLTVSDEYDAATGEYTITIAQSCPATPGQDHKQPFHMPIALGLLGSDGQDLVLDDNGNTTAVLELTEEKQSFTLTVTAQQKPVPSLLRGFSAPVKLNYPYTRDELVFLMRNDSDGFNRWEASQKLAVIILQELIKDYQKGQELILDERLINAYESILDDVDLDPAMVAKILSLPSEAYLSELADVIDVDAIHAARHFVKRSLADALESSFIAAYNRADLVEEYSPDADSIARRSLRNTALAYLVETDKPQHIELAKAQFDQANNMTDSTASLALLAHSTHEEAAADVLERFYAKWSEESLVVNQWLGVQATDPKLGTLAKVQKLMEHPAFTMKNPNRVRALISNFAMQNPVNFHQLDGSGYVFLADRIIELNALNPQIASRLVTPLTRWRRYSEARQALMKGELQRIMDSGNLSRDVYEVVSKSLA